MPLQADLLRRTERNVWLCNAKIMKYNSFHLLRASFMLGAVFIFIVIISVSPQNKPEENDLSPKYWFEPWSHPLQKSSSVFIIGIRI